MRRLWHDHGLSIVLIGLFMVTMVGQTWSGWLTYNEEQRQHGQSGVGLPLYLRTGHFGEATFENGESEFLSLAAMVVMSIFLRQRGSPESKPVDAPMWETGS